MKELRRVFWPLMLSLATIIAIDVIGVNPMSRWAVLLNKLATIALAVIVAHFIRSQLFPYLDFSEELRRGGSGAIAAAIVVATTIAAIVLGVALGL